MYYILPEGLQIESNEPVYCTLYIIHEPLRCASNQTPLTNILTTP